MLKKGDTILYRFAFSVMEAKVIKVYGDNYIKVRHKDSPILNWLFGYTEIINTDRVLK